MVLDAPEYPNDVEWRTCELDGIDFPCLRVEDAAEFAKYLAAVLRYHESIKETCGE